MLFGSKRIIQILVFGLLMRVIAHSFLRSNQLHGWRLDLSPLPPIPPQSSGLGIARMVLGHNRASGLLGLNNGLGLLGLEDLLF